MLRVLRLRYKNVPEHLVAEVQETIHVNNVMYFCLIYLELFQCS